MNKEREKKKGKELGIRVRCWKYLSREGRRTNCEEEEQEGIAPSIKKCSNYLAMSCCCLKKSDRSQSELIWAPTADKETNWQIVHPCHFLKNFQLDFVKKYLCSQKNTDKNVTIFIHFASIAI